MTLYLELDERNKVHFLMLKTLHDSIKIVTVKKLMAPLSLAYKNYGLFRSVLYGLDKSAI